MLKFSFTIFKFIFWLLCLPFMFALAIVIFLFEMVFYILLLLGLVVCIMIGPFGWAILGFCLWYGYSREKERRHREIIAALYRRNE